MVLFTGSIYQKSLHIQAMLDRLSVSKMCWPILSEADHRFLHSADHGPLVVPRYRLTTADRRAFSCAGLSAQNSLPAFLRDETLTLDSFKHYLKSFLFTQYYHDTIVH